MCFRGAELLEKMAMDLMPTADKDKTLSGVCQGFAVLGRSPLASFVTASSKGPFQAAAQMLNQLERDLPLKMDEVSGIQLGKQKHDKPTLSCRVLLLIECSLWLCTWWRYFDVDCLQCWPRHA